MKGQNIELIHIIGEKIREGITQTQYENTKDQQAELFLQKSSVGNNRTVSIKRLVGSIFTTISLERLVGSTFYHIKSWLFLFSLYNNRFLFLYSLLQQFQSFTFLLLVFSVANISVL